jgi:MFS family permease
MSQSERQGWSVIAALWVVMFFTIGATISTIGVFFNPLIAQFGWNHEQVSRIATGFILCMGISAPAAGWMLDWVPAQLPMGLGATAAAAGYLLASRSNSLAGLIAAFALIGAGVGSATLVPGTIVAANWFKQRRGLAIGVAISGSAVGATVMPPAIAHAIIVHGWRVAMLCLGAPIFAISLPVILAMIRTRPPGEQAADARRQATQETAGLELGAAISVVPFWLLAAVQVFFTVAYQGVYYHLVPYFIGIGYSPERAALIFGAKSLFVTIGTIILGAMADRIGPRKVLAFGMTLLCLSLVDLLAAARSPVFGLAAIVLFVIGYGSATGTTVTTIPMLMGECLGMRRFATLMGIIGFIATVASALGPIVTGLIFDLTGSYWLPFSVCGGMFAAAAITALIIYPAPGHDQVAFAQELAAAPIVVPSAKP